VSGWRTAPAPAKLNLALVVGPIRPDGKHEVVTVLERLALHDTVSVRQAGATSVAGFAEDTLVRSALDAVTSAAAESIRFEARLEKRIPVAAGLGGGSTDAATALALANGLLESPLPPAELDRLAASLGADVPFFLRDGPQLGTGDGTALEPLALPRDYTVLLALEHGETKSSSADVYAAFDARAGAVGFEERRLQLLESIAAVRSTDDLGRLPPNDLASSSLAEELVARGAARADVTGAGPTVFGLFANPLDAERAAEAVADRAATWVTRPA
jgi:4-diphosphocytidyl-2-C-methyl-D-erythritol kinase